MKRHCVLWRIECYGFLQKYKVQMYRIRDQKLVAYTMWCILHEFVGSRLQLCFHLWRTLRTNRCPMKPTKEWMANTCQPIPMETSKSNHAKYMPISVPRTRWNFCCAASSARPSSSCGCCCSQANSLMDRKAIPTVTRLQRIVRASKHQWHLRNNGCVLLVSFAYNKVRIATKHCVAKPARRPKMKLLDRSYSGGWSEREASLSFVWRTKRGSTRSLSISEFLVLSSGIAE